MARLSRDSQALERQLGELSDSLRDLKTTGFEALLAQLRQTNQRLAAAGLQRAVAGDLPQSATTPLQRQFDQLALRFAREFYGKLNSHTARPSGSVDWRPPHAEALKPSATGADAAATPIRRPGLGWSAPDAPAAGSGPAGAYAASSQRPAPFAEDWFARRLQYSLASLALDGRRSFDFGLHSLMRRQLQGTLASQGWFRQLARQFAALSTGSGLGGGRTVPQLLGAVDLYSQAHSGTLSPLSGALEGYLLGGPVGAAVGLVAGLFGHHHHSSSRPRTHTGHAYNAPASWESGPYLYNLSRSGAGRQVPVQQHIVVNLHDHSGRLSEVARKTSAALGEQLARRLAFAHATLSTQTS